MLDPRREARTAAGGSSLLKDPFIVKTSQTACWRAPVGSQFSWAPSRPPCCELTELQGGNEAPGPPAPSRPVLQMFIPGHRAHALGYILSDPLDSLQRPHKVTTRLRAKQRTNRGQPVPSGSRTRSPTGSLPHAPHRAVRCSQSPVPPDGAAGAERRSFLLLLFLGVLDPSVVGGR